MGNHRNKKPRDNDNHDTIELTHRICVGQHVQLDQEWSLVNLHTLAAHFARNWNAQQPRFLGRLFGDTIPRKACQWNSQVLRTPSIPGLIKCHGKPWASNRDDAAWVAAGRRVDPRLRSLGRRRSGQRRPLLCLTTHGFRVSPPPQPLHFSVAPRRLGGAVGSFAAALRQTQEKEDEDGKKDGDGNGVEYYLLCLVYLSVPALVLYLVSMSRRRSSIRNESTNTGSELSNGAEPGTQNVTFHVPESSQASQIGIQKKRTAAERILFCEHGMRGSSLSLYSVNAIEIAAQAPPPTPTTFATSDVSQFLSSFAPCLELCLLSAASYNHLVSCYESDLELLSIRTFYNSCSCVALFACMSALHNVAEAWIGIAIQQMKRRGLVLASHLVKEAECSSDDDDAPPGKSEERKGFLMTVTGLEYTMFQSGYNDSSVQPAYVIADTYKLYPNLAVEVGQSQDYDRNPRLNGLLDRVDLLLKGTSGRVRAVIVVTFQEDPNEEDFRRRFAGFIELWRGLTSTSAYSEMDPGWRSTLPVAMA
ncbi:hypothetical protein FN846DRAFT_886169 [Sphaerosporella brunnea]|uniref:Uncharacterized protein n=1 Tax=Sphaerosporella brunnea TaxID=1250544 RepID=A0A5J5FAD9_9PEZI|nr:hypothetical protein FN846DRAFT_886169 [Sphaerosporella brunnea]